MTNQTRRELLDRHKQSGFPGSIIDVFSAYNAGRDLISEFIQEQQLQRMQQQRQPIVANTPEQQEQGLRPFHERGQVDQSMIFPNIPANTPFNTVGMKAPINIDKYDNQGHLIESFKSVPPGIQNLPTGPQEGTVVETPANMRSGGVRKYQYAGPVTGAPRVPALSDSEMSLKIIQEANAGNPAARRMRSDYGQRMFLPGETVPSTHYMASFDNYAVPTIQENYIGGPLSYNPNPAPSKADFRFNTPEQAAYFAENYKQASAAKAFQQKNGGVRKYQGGGSKNVDPFSAFEIAKHMARVHGGTPQQYLALSDTAGYHESAHTMDPKMVQKGSGIAKGAFQIEASTIPRLQQRVRQYAEQTGNKVPSWINIPDNDARNLSLDRQRALFLLDMNYSDGTNMRAYAQGKTTSAEQWLQGWKRKEAADGKDIERFETSANKARQMGIPNSALTEFNRLVQDKKPIPPQGSYRDLMRQLNPLNKYK